MSSQLPIRYTQNFLHDRRLVERLVGRTSIQPADTVLEIGPGKGIITQAVADQVGETGRIVAVELDSTLAATLTQQFAAVPHIEIVQQDILNFALAQLGRDYRIFSNVPFNITSLLLTYLLHPTGGLTADLILQTDALVATTKWGTAETLKSLLIKPLYTIEITHQFKRSDFRPQPGVETALFTFERRTTPLIAAQHYDQYQDWLAFVSRDRVGEGAWLKVFSKKQIGKLGLVVGRGIKSQTADALINAFHTFRTFNQLKFGVISGAMHTLRQAQIKKEQTDRQGGHRRKRRR